MKKAMTMAASAAICLLLQATAATAAPDSNRAYKKPPVTKGSPARPLTKAAPGKPSERALGYVRAHGGELGLSAQDLEDVVITGESRSKHTGISHVYVRQRIDGIEVFGADANLSIGADGSVLTYGSSFLPDVSAAANRRNAALRAESAVEAAARQVGLEPAELEATEVKGGPEQETIFNDGGIATGPIAAKLVYQPVGPSELRLAWQVDFEEKSGQHLWRMTVDAETGEVLNQEDYTSHDNWDAPAGTGGGFAHFAGSALSAASLATIVTPNPVNEGSSYRVYALPLESPNDGDRTVVENPADALASPFGWHDTDGATGPEFTITRGNNAHAYLDRDANNLPDPGLDADGGPGLDFDFDLDLTQHPHDYGAAAVTNLFYWCNIAHDVSYLYGFDEASGNFQANNYGRGAGEGDYVRCEAQDGTGTNNANFSTPASVGTPRMQMFLWEAPTANLVTIDPPSPAAGDYEASGAAFGPALDDTGISGSIVLANDGTALPNEGCFPFVGFPAGSIALVYRGTCPFVTKVQNAQDAGAIGVIVGNNVPGNPTTLGGTAPGIVIPSGMVTQADAQTIEAGLPATGTFRANPGAVTRDGDLEAGIVLHEYAHGISNRLTGGPGINCLSGNEQAGEGWSDYYAITILLDPSVDDPDGTRGLGTYAVYEDSRQGFGIRPRPYSRNMEIQPFTYDSIKTGGWLNGASLALPHGLGHGWAAVLWDMTWNLVEKYGFNPDVYGPWDSGGNNRSLQYVTDGLKFQGCGPGLVAARNGILAATEAAGGEDTCTVWSSFARRGLGYSAVQGTTNRNDNSEAFDTAPDCRAGFQNPVKGAYGELNVRAAGSTVPVKFNVGPGLGQDILASHSPYSRRVDCGTLQVPSVDPAFITPREPPVAASPAGNSGLSFNKRGVYTYAWQTEEAWAGTCRELVVTREDGIEHRAFFEFVEAE